MKTPGCGKHPGVLAEIVSDWHLWLFRISNTGLFAVFAGRKPYVLGEHLNKMAEIVISDLPGNLCDGQIGNEQQGLRFANAALNNILHQRRSGNLFEQAE